MKNAGRKNSLWIVIVILGITCIAGCSGGKKTKDADSIKIGAIVPLSGNDSVLGVFTLKGLQLAVDEQNLIGGLLNRKIELDIQDSKGDPEEGEILVKKMMEQEVKPFMVYAIVSGVALAIKPETEANNTILMAAVGSDDFLKDSKFTVRNYISATRIGTEVSQYLKDTLNVSGLTLFHSDNAYGTSVKDALAKACTEKNIAVVTEPFDENSTDYANLISAGTDKNTECVFVTGIGFGLGRMLKQIKESGYNGKIICDQFITYPDVEETGGEALKGITYLDFAFDPASQDPTARAFVDAFGNRFSAKPQSFTVITYDGFRLLCSVAEKAGNIDPEVLMQELDRVQNYQGVFGPVSVAGRNLDFPVVFKIWN